MTTDDNHITPDPQPDPIREEWKKTVAKVQKIFGKNRPPDLNAILLLIGINETGIVRTNYTKEEKQDLMHVAVCTLLSGDGFYELLGKDKDGWPHWEQLVPLPPGNSESDERFIKQKVIRYFEKL